MFGTYFKASWKALPWISILPLLANVLYAFVIWPNFIEEGAEFSFESGRYVFSDGSLLLSVFTAIAVNLLFVMIIPGAIGGTNTSIKKAQFYIGFTVNLFLTLLLPLVYLYIFTIDGLTAGILIALNSLCFLLPFILGSLFVAPAYNRSFWFINRN
ncbi:MAG: hypothetical protein Ta2F_17290 [Termitinemataceae bacterium]|nr:MAG: hypothetical protein Ta2F_17290 [Termitinemataceae bacterium]